MLSGIKKDTIAIETAKFTKITIVIDPPTMCYILMDYMYVVVIALLKWFTFYLDK